MGAIIKAQDLSLNKSSGLLRPIIYCCSYGNLHDEAKSINFMLAEKLINHKSYRRTMHIEKCFNQVLSNFPDEVVIKDFDVMFNPAYKVDVLKIMLTAYKSKQFSVIWPGKYENGKLLYAEEGYPDYKTFNIVDYDITCVV
jgi:purine nucleoside phosphorylase